MNVDHIESAEPREEMETAALPAAPPIFSRFLFVDIAALRAKQLRRGALPRVDLTAVSPPAKAERIAMEEVRRGLVPFALYNAKGAGGEESA